MTFPEARKGAETAPDPKDANGQQDAAESKKADDNIENEDGKFNAKLN